MASLALTTSGLPPPTGVSVNISTEFLRPGGTEGDELVLESEVLKLGMSLPFLSFSNRLAGPSRSAFAIVSC
jgi:acyl-coenzyme A thioesterase 13